MSQVFEGSLRSAQTAVGESESTIASNIAANWPAYNGQPLKEALDQWNQIISRASMGTLSEEPVMVGKKQFKEPWRNYGRFHVDKRDRISSLVIEKITFRVNTYNTGRTPKREEWHFVEPNRTRIVEVVRDEKGHFVKGFPPQYITDISGTEFF